MGCAPSEVLQDSQQRGGGGGIYGPDEGFVGGKTGENVPQAFLWDDALLKFTLWISVTMRGVGRAVKTASEREVCAVEAPQAVLAGCR